MTDGARQVLGRSAGCAGVLITALLAACATQREVTRLVAGTLESTTRMSALHARLGEARKGDAPAVVVVQSGNELIGVRLDSAAGEAQSWRRTLRVTEPPVLGHSVVVFGSGPSFVALESRSGAPLWSVPAGGAALLAATDDGTFTALTLAQARGGQRSLVVYDKHPRERLRIQVETELGEPAMLGAPALLGGALLVPWGRYFLSAVDVESREELGRVRTLTPVLHALWVSGDLFWGGPPWVAFANAENTPYALPRRPLPSRVEAGPERSQDDDVTRLYVHPRARPEPERDDFYMGTYGRIAFGLDTERGALRWVIALRGRVLAGAALADGFAVCDDTGLLSLLDAADGRVQSQKQLAGPRRLAPGEPLIQACAIGPGRVFSSAAPEPREPAASLLEQMSQVLGLSDPKLSDAQRFLSRELAARPEPEATRVLIDLVSRHSLDRTLQAEAEDLLATRRNGEDYMLQALSRTGAFGGDPAALPPIAPLGEALAALGEARAAPFLAQQINHPAYAPDALARAAAALEGLASEAEYRELSVFFSLHRTHADEPERVAAVSSIGRILLRIGGESGRRLVSFAARDPSTSPDVRTELTHALEVGATPQGGP